MRLITKTTLLFLVLALIVFGIGGIVIYKGVQKEVARETDYALRYHLKVIVEGVEAGKPIEDYLGHKVRIQQLDGTPVEESKPVFTDTMAMHPQLDRMEIHRKLTVVKPLKGINYRIEIMDVFIETGDVFDGVVKIMTRLFLVLSVVLVLFSFLISRQVFKPFQESLRRIANFNLNSNKQLEMPQTSIKEFKDLNQFVTEMTDKARKDYLSLKEFSENASHEMQTPIAIAKGKLEILLESNELQPEQFQLIESAQQALSRLSKLGQALSLLTKIENKEFSNAASIDFSDVVNETASNFKEIVELKGLKMNKEVQSGVLLPIDSALADILVANLLKNAVQHNIENGWIQIDLNENQLSVKNSGLPPTVPTEELFNRFRKSRQASSSLGLGLAIVQKICEANDFKINYTFVDGTHQLVVRFRN